MRRVLAVASVSLLILAACGGSDSTGPGTLAHGTLSASVNGASWSPVALSATYSNGILAVGGSNSVATLAFAGFVSGPATISTSGPGFANATYSSNTAAWGAASGTPGGIVSITVTSLTTTTAAGSFSFTLPPSAGTTASGTKTITGTFNVKF